MSRQTPATPGRLPKDLLDAFGDQARACAELGSPFMERLCSLLARPWPDTGDLAARLAAFEGDPGPSGHSLPLRVAGGLHALHLSGRAPELARVYAPRQRPEDADFAATIHTALVRHQVFLSDWIASAPQTNEIRRSAVLIAAAAVLAGVCDLPFRLSELGASGGLNLWWDHYALDAAGTRIGPQTAPVVFTPDWTGPPPPRTEPATLPRVVERRGVDLNPLDLSDTRDFLRLAAYLWADQPERLTMTRAGAALGPAIVDRGDAIDWLERRLDNAPEGQLHLIQNTVAWQYFPQTAQARGAALIEAAGARATARAPVAWVQMENDGHGPGAAIGLRIWPGDIRMNLGRADFHGRWVDWR